VPVCPTCHDSFPDDTGSCPRDGTTLVVTQALADAATLPELAAAPPATAPAPSGSFDSLVGATLANRYTILRRIGEGGMGAVYEARHAVIGKRVAVKVLLEKFLAKSDFVARLLQEARLASSIGHENIVDVIDFGTTDDGRSFVVMEFLDGESLAQLLMREAPLPVERSLRLARQVASALSAAHAKGIVHRDVKPENVYIVRRGDADFVKVVDFGISKAVRQGQGDSNDDGLQSLRLTHTGLLLGTPLYMSPEQARGAEDLDHRVDIWALGVMLYECLTGEVPFRANNYLGIISQVLNHVPVPPSQLRPELGIPESVEAVVMRAMEKDRARRTATMSDLEGELERLLAGDQNVGLTTLEAAAVEVVPRGIVHRWHLGLAAGILLVGGAVLVLTRPDAGPSSKVGRAETAPAAVTASVAGPAASTASSGSASAGPASTGPVVAGPPSAAARTGATVPPAAAVGTPRPSGEAPASAGNPPTPIAQPAGTLAAKKKRPPPRPTRHPTPASAATPSAPESVGIPESVMRGVLSPHSREGYPDSR